MLALTCALPCVQDLFEMERSVLAGLTYQLTVPTAIHFLHCFTNMASVNNRKIQVRAHLSPPPAVSNREVQVRACTSFVTSCSEDVDEGRWGRCVGTVCHWPLQPPLLDRLPGKDWRGGKDYWPGGEHAAVLCNHETPQHVPSSPQPLALNCAAPGTPLLASERARAATQHITAAYLPFAQGFAECLLEIEALQLDYLGHPPSASAAAALTMALALCHKGREMRAVAAVSGVPPALLTSLAQVGGPVGQARVLCTQQGEPPRIHGLCQFDGV